MTRGELEKALGRALEDPSLRVLGIHPAGGGCIHSASRIATTAGDFFAKWNDDCPDDAFLREADGLRELAATGSDLAVPRVLDAQPPSARVPAFILMEYLPPATQEVSGHDEALGRGLAAIHRRTAPSYGFDTDTYCGPTRQDNTRSRSWVEFYGERRLRPLVGLLESKRALPATERKTYDRLIERLSSLVPEGAPPSLIHGDLWSGNVMRSARGPAVFDPACAYSDREMEFGITTLFGGFAARFWSAYEEAWPLPEGWHERNPLYQLYHLLNHFLIFGGHYGREAIAIAKRFA